MNRVVFQKVHEVLHIFGIIDGHDLELVVLIEEGLAEHEATNAAESVDTYLD